MNLSNVTDEGILMSSLVLTLVTLKLVLGTVNKVDMVSQVCLGEFFTTDIT